MSASILDVAKLAGVSSKTVSRVINGEPHVRPAKRDAVMKAVADLDYRPNAFARSLSSSRSYMLAFLTDNPRSSYAADVHIGALHRCREKSYHMVVEQVERSEPGWAERLAASLHFLRLDGALLTPPLCDDPIILSILEAAKVPYVRLSPGNDLERSAYVRMDDEAAAADMTQHLINLGHQRIGFIKGDPEHSVSAKRYAGFCAQMAINNLSVDQTLIAEGDFSARSGLACGGRILGAVIPPTAIFASNDDMALGVLMAASKKRLDVPTQLAIAGFDDAPLSRAAWPPISTVRQPNAEMAAAAIDMLTHRQYVGEKPDSVEISLVLDYSLIARGSTCPNE